MRTRLAALALLLFAACARPPVTDEVTVQFLEDSEEVQITAETRFDVQSRSARAEAARAAALNGTDAWSARFGRLTPELERVTFQRERGTLERVVHAVRIPADDLQRVFADTNVTMHVVRGDGWRELTLYPGTSTRASREQQRQFEEQLASWSHDVARYFRAIDHLYDYLDENPQRAEAVFGALVAKDPEAEIPLAEDDEPFVTAVMEAMERIATRMDAAEGNAHSFAEMADLIHNPFPGRMVFRVPGEEDLVIEPVDLFGAIAALEGTWISPDPLAALLKNEIPSAAELADMERKASPAVDAGEITRAIREQLQRPKTYSIRWRD